MGQRSRGTQPTLLRSGKHNGCFCEGALTLTPHFTGGPRLTRVVWAKTARHKCDAPVLPLEGTAAWPKLNKAGMLPSAREVVYRYRQTK